MSDSPGDGGKIIPFACPEDWWWDWRDDREVVAWQVSGATIGFREELDELGSRLGAFHWPPAGAIVLFMAACRDGWDAAIARGEIGRVLDRIGGSDADRGVLRDVIDGLCRIAGLPRELRTTARDRLILAEKVFGVAERPPGADASPIDVDIWLPLGGSVRPVPFPPATLDTFREELRAILPGLALVDEASLRRRIGTGLDELPIAAEPLDVPLSDGGAFRGLPAEWLDDPRTCGVARLARQVMAVVSLPRALEAPEDLPEGGIADITNRGPLDRLLLSELAHDEPTLAARLALGEALYHRRELAAPPPPRARRVLLDCGVRMWGVPRVYATAVALALRAQAGAGIETIVHRAAGKGLEPVDLASTRGLVEHLGALETAAHPGDALAPFAAAGAAVPTDAVLVTCDEVLADPDFERCLAASTLDGLHVASVSREGRLRMLVRSRRGTRLVKEATLDVERLLAARPGASRTGPATPPLFEPDPHDLPAIFGVDPIPLRLTVAPDFETAWLVEGFAWLSLTRDGRLLVWDRPAAGAKQLADGLPGSILFASQPAVIAGRTLAVIGHPNRPMCVLSIDPLRGVVRRTLLPVVHRGGACVTIHQGRVLVRGAVDPTRPVGHPCTLHEIDPSTGDVTSSCDAPRGGRQIGRVVHNADGGGSFIMAVAPARCLRVPGDGRAVREALAVFETEGADGLTIVGRDDRGRIGFFHGADSRWVGLPMAFQREHLLDLKGVSPDGRRFWFRERQPHASYEWRVEVPSGRNELLVSPKLSAVGRRSEGLVHSPHVAVSGVAVTGDGDLAFLKGQEGRLRSLVPEKRWIVLATGDMAATPGPRAFFGRSRRVRGYGVRTLRFGDGTRAWSDTRGLVHLRSSDPSLPEVTLMPRQHPQPVFGWLSDGRVFGPACFHGGDATDAGIVYREVLRAIAAAIRD